MIRDAKGRVKGFAYLQLKDASRVPQAITALNNAKLNGRTIRAEKTKLKEQVVQQATNAIVVTNLSFSVREEALEKFLTDTYGPVKSVALIVDDHKRSKGYAFVEF